MPITEDYLGYEPEDQPGYMQPHKYKLRLRCLRCGNEYSKVVASLNAKNPPCPRKACKEAALEEEVQKRVANITGIVDERSFPGITGDKPLVRAIDITAEACMSDYGLTDLKDNVREGDTVAPKLPPAMQRQADAMFDPKKAIPGMSQRKLNALVHRATNGSFKGNAVGPTEVFSGQRGESPLWSAGART